MGYKIGIIDDEFLIREGIKKKIRLSQFEVVYDTDDGHVFLEDLTKGKIEIDILLMDIRMPKISGLEIAERLRKLNFKIPIILLSGYSEFEYARKAILLEIDNYLLKPVGVEELNEALQILETKLGRIENKKEEAETRLVRKVKTGKETVEEIRVWIKNHYSEHITLKETAEKFFINRSHLARLFKEVSGQTFNEFLTEVRMEKACELLGNQKYNLEDVARLTGYEDKKYFQKVFVKIKGINVQKFKEQNK